MKRFLLISNVFVFALVALVLASMVKGKHKSITSAAESADASGQDSAAVTIINPDGTTLEERFAPPSGYERVEVKSGSIGEFLRSYELKADGEAVRLYDGTEADGQDGNAAVFTLPLEEYDFQQSPDSIMRVWGEYYYSKGKYDKISFSLGDNFEADFDTWSSGKGINFEDDKLSWSKNKANDDSYESFVKYMRMVFAYSGIWNLIDDSKEVSKSNLQVGDFIVQNGNASNAVMIVDLCKNENGEMMMLLASGGSTACEFHVLKNPNDDSNPWYSVEDLSSSSLTIPGFTFKNGKYMSYK